MQLVKDFQAYEKDNFQKFTTYGTKTVNGVLKRNILKLEFCDTMLGKVGKGNQAISVVTLWRPHIVFRFPWAK